MYELHQIECRTGPLSDDERWAIRFGGRDSYERACARGMIRHITRACMTALDMATFRDLYEYQKEWRAYLRGLA